MKSIRAIIWAVPVGLALAVATTASAQVDAARFQKCSPIRAEWDKANQAGIPGRRKAMKAVLDAAKADPVIGECLSDKIREDLSRAAATSSALQGWSALLRTNTNNFDAAKDQLAADRCPASRLVIAGWNAFYANWRDASPIVNEAAQRRHRQYCGG